MAQRYYPAGSYYTVRPSGHPSGTRSAKFPWGTNNSAAVTPQYLAINPTYYPAPGFTSAGLTTSYTSLAQTTQQSAFQGHVFISLGAGTFGAGTWSFAVYQSESNNSANTYMGVSIYVWRPSTSAVVGYIYDNNVQLGAEASAGTTSITFSVTGTNVTSQNGDVLIIEFWQTAAQGASMSYTNGFNFGATTGNPDITADGQSSSNSWIDAPALIPAAAQTLTPTNVTNTATFGAPTVALLAETQSLSATAVANVNAYGTPTVAPGAVSLTVTGVANTQGFGSHAITVGAVSLTPTSVQNTQAFGSPAISLTLSVSGVANSNAYGASTVAPGAVTVTPSAVANTQAFGTPALSHTVSATGVENTQAFGAPTLRLNVVPTAVINTNAFGLPAAAPGAVTLTTTGVANSQAFGFAVIAPGPVTLNATSVLNSQAFGAAAVAGQAAFLTVAGVTNSQAFGAPTATKVRVVLRFVNAGM